jgi:hypothetical protein
MLDKHIGLPCDIHGTFLPPGCPLPEPLDPPQDDWTPFDSRVAFELAEFLYTRNQMPGRQIDTLMDLWSASMVPHGAEAPFDSARDLYKTIDASTAGDVKWESFQLKYEGIKPAENIPSWMDQDLQVWYRNPHEIVRNILANSSFDGEVNTTPHQTYDANGNRQYGDFMSGDWAWRQAVGSFHCSTGIY